VNPEFASPEAALAVLSDPREPRWADAFAYLSAHPDTGASLLEAFRDTLAQLGVEPGGVDPVTGEPVYSAADVARAMGLPDAALTGEHG
jgi:hypothetical protein